MSERLSSEYDPIEHALLWDQIQELFAKNAHLMGIQMCLDDPDFITKYVLSGELDEDFDLRLWGVMSEEQLLGGITLIYVDKEGNECYSYELRPDGIRQYADQPSALDKEDLQDMRRDLEVVQWSAAESEKCAEKLIFYT